MGNCYAIGIGYAVSDGPCSATGPSVDDAVKALEKAIENAETEASKSCPSGSKCEGVAVPLGPPTCSTVHVGKETWCICSVAVQLDGNCEDPNKKPPPPDDGKAVKGKDFREFFREVEKLPELPKNPTGECRMYRQQLGHGFWYPICAGECASGKCKTRIEVRKRAVLARCSCQ